MDCWMNDVLCHVFYIYFCMIYICCFAYFCQHFHQYVLTYRVTHPIEMTIHYLAPPHLLNPNPKSENMGTPSGSIEFVVKPREDLYLEGSTSIIKRVLQGTQYPCQMQRNQSFSCLFRYDRDDMYMLFSNRL